MPDRRVLLWSAAVFSVAAPWLYWWIRDLLGGSTRTGYVVSFGACPGLSLELDIAALPFFHELQGRAELVVGAAFAVWAVGRWRSGGETPIGRVAGWVAVGYLLFFALYQPVLMALDAGRGQCWAAWRPFVGFPLGWDLYHLVPAALLVAAVYRPSRILRAVRVGAGLLGVALLVTVVGADRSALPRGTIDSDERACVRARTEQAGRAEPPMQAIARMPMKEREMAFLCGVRGHLPPMAGSHPEDRRPDKELLAHGRKVCSSLRRSGSVSPDELRDLRVAEPARLAGYLCPEVVAQRLPMVNRSAEQIAREARAYVERQDAACKKPIRRGPHPYHQKTKAMSLGEDGTYYVMEGEGVFGQDAFEAALDDGLVGAGRGGVAVMPIADVISFCLTVQAFRSAPAVSLRGWERVVEVGLDSPAGRARITTMEGEPEMPVVTAAGPGSYRVRVHVRGSAKAHASTSELPVEEHLIVVFPGKSKQKKVYKTAERS